MSSLLRLNRCLIGHSRKYADALIENGRVKVNGSIARLGDRVKAGDQISVDNKLLENWEKLLMSANTTNTHNLEELSKSFIHLKMWKPMGITCTTMKSDVDNIITFGNFNKFFKDRLLLLGRLDKESSGLVILTSNPRLQEIAFEKNTKNNTKKYEVLLEDEMDPRDIHTLEKGIEIKVPTRIPEEEEWVQTKPCHIKFLENVYIKSKDRELPVYEFSLVEGRNRQIHKMVNHLGYRIYGLHRVEFKSINIDDLQKPGDWKHLTLSELDLLYN